MRYLWRKRRISRPGGPTRDFARVVWYLSATGGRAMTLICSCGSHALKIVRQSYGEQSAFEVYECEACGDTGTLNHDDVTGTALTGCLTRDRHDAETGHGGGFRP
jgi:hypothetical protein